MAEEHSANAGSEYPGVDLAYDIAVQSYDLAERRWDGVNQRIDVFLSFVTTVTVAAPIVATAVLSNPDFRSPLLIAAGSVYLGLVVIALVVRSLGSLREISPKLLYDGWLHLDEDEFKRRLIFWAGQHADEARRKTYRKALAATFLAGLFVVEGALFLAWLVQGS